MAEKSLNKSFFETMRDCVIVYQQDAPNSILCVNALSCRFFHCASQEELLAMSGGSFFNLVVSQSGNTIVFRTKNGEYAQVTCFVSAAETEEGKVNIVLFRLPDMQNNRIIDFERALEQQDVAVLYQPVLRTLNSDVCGLCATWEWKYKNEITPYIDDRKTAKLNAYIINRACNQISVDRINGIAMIPVIFPLALTEEENSFEAVNMLIEGYNLPKTQIHFEVDPCEVTPEITEELRKFRNAGYHIWVKTDMRLETLQSNAFSRTVITLTDVWNERVRAALRSYVSLAKDLGIRVLVCNVRTQEQMDYLREVGCPYVMGGAVGEPMRMEKFRQLSYVTESLDELEYYEELSRRNFVNERAAAMSEFDGKNLTYLYTSDAYLKAWAHYGVEGVGEITALMNAVNSPLARQIREYKERVKSFRGPIEFDYNVGGDYIHIRAELIAQCGSKEAFWTEVVPTEQSHVVGQMDMDHVYRMLFSTMDSIYIIDLKNNEITPVLRGTRNISKYKEVEESSVNNVSAVVAKNFVHPYDHKIFFDFVNQETIKERATKDEKGYTSVYLRTKKDGAGYVWKKHCLQYIPTMDKYLYSTTQASFNSAELRDRLVNGSLEIPDSFDNSLWSGIMNSCTLNLFWKDRERRFVGASQSFMDAYGIDDVSELLGKTDEDMGWHIDNAPYNNEEQKVLQNGIPSVGKLGKCIIKGVTHNIIATKEPLYENGKIIGLVGYFINLDELIENAGHAEIAAIAREHAVDTVQVPSSDTVREIASNNMTLSKEIEQLRYDSTGVYTRIVAIDMIRNRLETKRPGKFTLIMLDVDELKYINDTFGHSTGDTALEAAANIFKSSFRKTDVAGRIGGDEFILFVEDGDEERMRNRLESVMEKIHNVIVHLPTQYHLSCSIGYIIEDYGTVTFEEAYERVDKVLYQAKKAGKNQLTREKK